MKFPLPVAWRFLLHMWRKSGARPIEEALRTTLDAMASGGIHDPIDGGFHRYSTDPRWEVPHFEKMLYDNAQLAALYLEAGAALGEPRYTSIGADTLDFLLRDMRGDDGGFYASLDADSGGHEGAYYVFDPAQLRAIAGADADVLAAILGVRARGPIEGASVVNRRASFDEVASRFGRTPADVAALWDRMRPALRSARAARPRPRLDAKVVTAWNGLTIGALALGYASTGDARYRDAAERAADLLWRTQRLDAGGLARASNGGRVDGRGVLEDYAFLAEGLIALFEAAGRPDDLAHATTLVREATTRFAGPDGRWFAAEQGATPLARQPSLEDGVEPSGASSIVHAEEALLALTQQAPLEASIDVSLAAAANRIRSGGTDVAGWLDAALLRTGPYYDVIVADAGGGAALTAQWRALLPPWATLATIPGAGPDPSLLQLVPVSSGKTAGGRAARAFVCTQGACKAPTDDPATLRAQILEGWAR
jgi:uncharacterized protein YyaL (SSP411 family)